MQKSVILGTRSTVRTFWIMNMTTEPNPVDYTSQGRWMFPSWSWEVRNSIMMMMITIIIYLTANGLSPDGSGYYACTQIWNKYGLYSGIMGDDCWVGWLVVSIVLAIMLPASWGLGIETAGCAVTLVKPYQTTWYYNLEGNDLNLCDHETLKCCTVLIIYLCQ